MKGRVVVLLEEAGRPAAAALTDGGRLLDLLVDPPADDPAPRIEEIRVGRVVRMAPAMGAAFLDLGGGAEGFLKGSVKGLAAGDRLLVQVVRHAERGKASPVTAEPLLKGRYAILTPHAPGVNVSRRIRDAAEADRLKAAAEAGLSQAGAPKTGVILRSAAEGVAEQAVAEDVAALAGLLAEMAAAGDAPGLVVAAPDAETRAWRDWATPEPDEVVAGDWRLWDDLGLVDRIAALFEPRVELPGGAWMTVEPTAALVAVDVNTAGDMSPASGLKANLAAAEALPRELLLRGLGGQIVVDFAPMGKRERKGLEGALGRALRDDPVETQVIGWTSLGHLELTRRRERRPLAELMSKP